jgi:hypothetical protein
MTTAKRTTERSGAPSASRPAQTGYPAASAGFEIAAVVLSGALLFGAFLDGWAHNNLAADLETFFTPWHAVLYGGLGGFALFITGAALLNMTRGYRLLRALPRGYLISLFGVGLMSVSGFGDFLWHSIFGIEFGFDASVSPTHLSAAFGIVLIMGGGLRAAWQRRALPADRARWGVLIVSAAFTLSAITIISQLLHPLVQPVASAALAPPAGVLDTPWYAWAFGSFALQTLFTSLIVLLMVARWGRALPFGTFAAIFGINALLMASQVNAWAFVPVWALGGLAADALMRVFDTTTRRGAWAFAAFAPVALYAVYFAFIVLTGGTWWRVHSITGVLTVVGVVGWVCGLLMWPPSIPAEDDAAA